MKRIGCVPTFSQMAHRGWYLITSFEFLDCLCNFRFSFYLNDSLFPSHFVCYSRQCANSISHRTTSWTNPVRCSWCQSDSLGHFVHQWKLEDDATCASESTVQSSLCIWPLDMLPMSRYNWLATVASFNACTWISLPFSLYISYMAWIYARERDQSSTVHGTVL